MLKDLNKSEILKNNSLINSFYSASLNEINQKCSCFKGDFYLDSFNFFPITNKNETFYSLFKRDDENSLDHFYTQEF